MDISLLTLLLKSGRKFELRPDGSYFVWPSSLPQKRVIRNRRFYQNNKTKRLPAGEWRPIREAVLNRDGHKCVYCGSDGGGFPLHCDHIIPVSRGGSHEMGNLNASCKRCNSSKGNRLIESWKHH